MSLGGDSLARVKRYVATSLGTWYLPTVTNLILPINITDRTGYRQLVKCQVAVDL